MTIESLPASRDNNFNLLRLIAAGAVIVSHSYPLSMGTPDPLQTWAGFALGESAVAAFFTVSGYFIALSFERRRSLGDFVVARALRIIPALAVVSIILAFVLGPLVSRTDAGDYYGSPVTWWYVPRSLSLFFLQRGLPGVFLSNPYPAVVNGPLWTLAYEVACYAMLAAAGICGLLTKRRFPFFVLLYFALCAAAVLRGSSLLTMFSTMAFPFVIGMAAYVYRDRIRYNVAVFALVIAAAVAMALLHVAEGPARALVIAYGCFLFGFAKIPGLHHYEGFGDPSYGLYIYGWPVQQTIVLLDPGIGPLALMALALLIALSCALMSWHLVERPARDLRKSLPGIRQRLSQITVAKAPVA